MLFLRAISTYNSWRHVRGVCTILEHTFKKMHRDLRYDVLKGLGIIMMVSFHGFAPMCVRQVGCCI